MDYGKLAYIKAEELEKRIAVEKKTRVICADYTVAPTFSFGNGKTYPVCSVKSEGTLALIIVLSFSGESGKGTAQVYLGDKSLISTAVDLADGETKTVVLTRAFSMSGNEIISVGASGSVKTLQSVQVVAFGQNADLITNLSRSAVDYNGEKWGLITSENDRVRMCPFSENEFDLTTEIFVGSGRGADICALGNGFVACYIDDQGNTTVAKITHDNIVTQTTVIGSGASACAIGKNGEKYILCEIVGDELYCRQLTDSMVASERVMVELPFAPDGISFVKGSLKPMLIIYSQGKSYLKVAQPSPQKLDSVSVTISFMING